MKVQSFNAELVYAQAQFQRLFSNIVLARKDAKDQNIIVPCIPSKRSRVFKNLENPDRGQITLPAIFINRSGFSRADERSNNIHDHLLKNPGSTIDYNTYMPVPINLTFEVTIVTKYPEDMEIILSNFIPFFNQDLYVRTKHPKIENQTIKHQVIWDGSVNEEWPDEFEPSQQDIQTATTSFTFKTWIFAGKALMDEIKRIQTVDFTLTGVPSSDGGFTGGFFAVPTDISFSSFYDDVTNGVITPEYDSYVVSGS